MYILDTDHVSLLDRADTHEAHRLRFRLAQLSPMDLKIGAIALVNSATLLTRNLKDFSKVPGLKVEDWAA